ncbi:MAG: hypothetical protein M1524_03905 [Patescibacteria group bacterium]|nr:hypothetical protein [Patescibacteria group bacterium]
MADSLERRPQSGVGQEPTQQTMSRLDAMLGSEATRMSKSERLTAKFEMIVQDPDMAVAIGLDIRDHLVQGTHASEFSEEQKEKVREALSETLDSLLTPEQRTEAARETELYMEKYGPGGKVSPFSW